MFFVFVLRFYFVYAVQSVSVVLHGVPNTGQGERGCKRALGLTQESSPVPVPQSARPVQERAHILQTTARGKEAKGIVEGNDGDRACVW